MGKEKRGEGIISRQTSGKRRLLKPKNQYWNGKESGGKGTCDVNNREELIIPRKEKRGFLHSVVGLWECREEKRARDGEKKGKKSYELKRRVLIKKRGESRETIWYLKSRRESWTDCFFEQELGKLTDEKDRSREKKEDIKQGLRREKQNKHVEVRRNEPSLRTDQSTRVSD